MAHPLINRAFYDAIVSFETSDEAQETYYRIMDTEIERNGKKDLRGNRSEREERGKNEKEQQESGCHRMSGTDDEPSGVPGIRGIIFRRKQYGNSFQGLSYGIHSRISGMGRV